MTEPRFLGLPKIVERAKEISASGRSGFVVALLLLCLVALAAPVLARPVPAESIGALLLIAGVLELLHSFRLASEAARRTAYVSSALTVLMGLLLLNAPFVAGAAMVLLLGGTFVLEGVRRVMAAWRAPDTGSRRQHSIAALGAFGAAAVLVVAERRLGGWTVALAGSLRIFGTAWNVATAATLGVKDAGRTLASDMGLPDVPQLARLADRVVEAEERRRGADGGWIAALLAVLFAIHLGRMQPEWTIVGLLSPLIAVAGDAGLALLLAYGVVVPLALLSRWLTRPLARRALARVLPALGPEADLAWPDRILRLVLVRRFRFAVRLRHARYSAWAALSRGLQIGLPLAAILVATVPIWGMNWYFDTENWAAGVWNSWAERRVDRWRIAMVRAAVGAPAAGPVTPPSFEIAPPGVPDHGDFSFLVIGDTGEGDMSQQSLRDQIILQGARDDVRFLVISSDVVYPTGAMKDYEAKFWMPFKGFRKPIYAIPGNHDWYDALEAFVATFYEPGAASAAMRARAAADWRLTSTTDARISRLIGEAARLRREYEIPTGFQEAPYFQLQRPRFALIAVDTGVSKRVDDDQMAWLRAALDRARGKFILALLGHPLYAGGYDQTAGNADFTTIHRLLRERGVQVVMAGDTHDLEYYEEPARASGAMRYFVNGGGGAYLSLGTSLSWPSAPPTPIWALYPSRPEVIARTDLLTPMWKSPIWWWTKQFDAWPASAEWLSAAFDYNAAPFFQSFLEVRVEPSSGRVRFLPWGVNGRLRWSDLGTSDGLRPEGRAADATVEFEVPMPPDDGAPP